VIRRLKLQIFRWARRRQPTAKSMVAALMPDQPFFAIGDIHGCTDLLDGIMRQVERAAVGPEPVVFVGDYIDRGRNSAQVLSWLFEVQQSNPGQVICLMGNHERMLLDFIDDPAGRGAQWLRNGGLDTLASFGVTLQTNETDTDAAIAIANALEAAMPAGLQDWLRGLPLFWTSGNVHCVHAAMSPNRAPEDQREDVLLWGHPDFMTSERDDGQFVLHGHTIVPKAKIVGSRISIDTGAYRTGQLSAVRVGAGTCEYFTV